MTFEEMNLRRELLDAVKKAGYTEPSPIQEKAIPVMMRGEDLIACAQTGTGKTAAFALPILNALEHDPKRPVRIQALVLTPTRELALQNYENFKKYGRYLRLRTAVVYGGASQGPQIRQLKKGCEILVATPGRLLDDLAQGLIDLSEVGIFVLDEADRMLDMGFIHDIRKVAAALPAKRQTVLFSATMPEETRRLAAELLSPDHREERVAPVSSPADTVQQRICFVEKSDKRALLLDLLGQSEVTRSIVFARTRHGADRLAKQLKKAGVPCVAIHGDKTQGQRQHALEQFRSGEADVLVATDVASRGLDIPHVSHVFNYDLPEEAESYIHRIGRAGRAGELGVSVTLCCEAEMELLYDIEKMMGRQIEEVKTPWSVSLERKKVPAAQKKPGRSRGNGRAGAKAEGRGGARGAGRGRSKSTSAASSRGAQKSPRAEQKTQKSSRAEQKPEAQVAKKTQRRERRYAVGAQKSGRGRLHMGATKVRRESPTACRGDESRTLPAE